MKYDVLLYIKRPPTFVSGLRLSINAQEQQCNKNTLKTILRNLYKTSNFVEVQHCFDLFLPACGTSVQLWDKEKVILHISRQSIILLYYHLLKRFLNLTLRGIGKVKASSPCQSQSRVKVLKRIKPAGQAS